MMELNVPFLSPLIRSTMDLAFHNLPRFKVEAAVSKQHFHQSHASEKGGPVSPRPGRMEETKSDNDPRQD